MKLTFSDAKVYGLENLPAHGESVVYVPNHTSYFDILMLSGYIPRPFKYLSKSEILDIPVVGYGKAKETFALLCFHDFIITAMKLAKHVFLRRNDLKSTVECAEKCVERV